MPWRKVELWGNTFPRAAARYLSSMGNSNAGDACPIISMARFLNRSTSEVVNLGVCPIFVAGWTQGKECGLQWEGLD